MTNSNVTSTAARLLSLFQTLCDWTIIFQLLDLSAREQWSPLISATVTHHSQNYCQVRNCQDMLFFLTWKRCKKELKLGSSIINFLLSFNWNRFYPFSISWHYRFKMASDGWNQLWHTIPAGDIGCWNRLIYILKITVVSLDGWNQLSSILQILMIALDG